MAKKKWKRIPLHTTKPQEPKKKKFGRYERLVTTAFVFTMIGLVGGLDGWLYWWVKSGLGHYRQAEFNISSAEPEYHKSRLTHLWAEGKVAGQAVAGALTDVVTDRQISQEKHVQRLVAAHPTFPVFWNGQAEGSFVQYRSTHLVEAGFILNPPSRVWWGPLSHLLACLLWIRAFRFRREALPFRRAPWRI